MSKQFSMAVGSKNDPCYAHVAYKLSTMRRISRQLDKVCSLYTIMVGPIGSINDASKLDVRKIKEVKVLTPRVQGGQESSR
jgi:hypothetical protein